LAKIAALKTGTDLVAFLREDFARGRGIVFQFGARADYNDAKMQIASTFQGGLGLPTPDYYSKDEYADLRKAYVEHVAKTLQLTGVAADDAARQADIVMNFAIRRISTTSSRLPKPIRRRRIFRGRRSSPRKARTSKKVSLCRSRSSSPNSTACSPTCQSRTGRRTCAFTSSMAPRHICPRHSRTRILPSTARR
jgi:hypothetical protein